jgi:hypothetical protein
MANGLQTFDSAAALTMDTNTRNGIVLGNIEIGASPYSGDISVPEGSTATIWFLTMPYNEDYTGTPYIYTSTTTNIHWQATQLCRLIYGVF